MIAASSERFASMPPIDPRRAARNILVIEDERDIAELIALHLEDLPAAVTLAHDGPSGLQLAMSREWDAIVLDIRLPGLNGLDLCRELRTQLSPVPILMLTARGSELDRVLGLELGADDYLTKPFSLAELMARVKALLRRAELLRQAQAGLGAGAAGATIRNGVLEIHPAKRTVRLRGDSLDCTAREFDLLLHFAQHPGHVFSRSQLLSAVWGYTHDGYEHTVTTHINRLRAKLEADPMQPELILTVRGAGYKMREAP